MLRATPKFEFEIKSEFHSIESSAFTRNGTQHRVCSWEYCQLSSFFAFVWNMSKFFICCFPP